MERLPEPPSFLKRRGTRRRQRLAGALGKWSARAVHWGGRLLPWTLALGLAAALAWQDYRQAERLAAIEGKLESIEQVARLESI